MGFCSDSISRQSRATIGGPKHAIEPYDHSSSNHDLNRQIHEIRDDQVDNPVQKIKSSKAQTPGKAAGPTKAKVTQKSNSKNSPIAVFVKPLDPKSSLSKGALVSVLIV